MDHRTAAIGIGVLAAVGIALPGAAHAQPAYDFILVDSFNANPLAGEAFLWDINDEGVACGIATVDNVIGSPGFVWDEVAGKVRIPVSNPLGVSNDGLVVGNQSIFDLVTEQPTSPPGLPGTYFGPSFGGVNDTGRVAVGSISTCSCSDSGGVLRIPYVWDAAGGARTVDIPNAKGLSRINNSGVAIGWLYSSVQNEAFVVDLESGAYTLMGDVFPPGMGTGPTRAFEINDLGEIVGTRYGSAPVVFYGYIYSPVAGVQLLPFPGAGYQQAVKPTGINDSGTIVGEIYTTLGSARAFVYSAAEGIRNLNDSSLVAGIPSGYTLRSAQKVNDLGWIVGNGQTQGGKNTGFVLKPRGGGCDADLDGDGQALVPDIFLYLGLWFAGDARADIDGAPGIGVPDLFAFLSLWFAGC